MLTVLQVEEELLSRIVPDDSDRFRKLLREADTMLLRAGKWQWVRERITVTPDEGFIFLPGGYEAILGASVGGVGIPSSWEEREFMTISGCNLSIDGSGAELQDMGLEEVDGDVLRKFRVGTLTADILLLARKRPITSTLLDADVLRCQNVRALKLAIFAVVYEESNNMKLAEEYQASALRELDREEASYRGVSNQVHKPSYLGFTRRWRNVR